MRGSPLPTFQSKSQEQRTCTRNSIAAAAFMWGGPGSMSHRLLYERVKTQGTPAVEHGAGAVGSIRTFFLQIRSGVVGLWLWGAGPMLRSGSAASFYGRFKSRWTRSWVLGPALWAWFASSLTWMCQELLGALRGAGPMLRFGLAASFYGHVRVAEPAYAC